MNNVFDHLGYWNVDGDLKQDWKVYEQISITETELYRSTVCSRGSTRLDPPIRHQFGIHNHSSGLVKEATLKILRRIIAQEVYKAPG